MSVKISFAFDVIRKVASSSGKYTADEIIGLDDCCKWADIELLEDYGKFSETIEMVGLALASGDEDQIASSLIHLRLASMAIATDWDNLTDAISELFERRAIRNSPDQTGKG